MVVSAGLVGSDGCAAPETCCLGLVSLPVVPARTGSPSAVRPRDPPPVRRVDRSRGHAPRAVEGGTRHRRSEESCPLGRTGRASGLLVCERPVSGLRRPDGPGLAETGPGAHRLRPPSPGGGKGPADQLLGPGWRPRPLRALRGARTGRRGIGSPEYIWRDPDRWRDAARAERAAVRAPGVARCSDRSVDVGPHSSDTDVVC